MKVLLSWMREFAPGLPDDPERISATLAELGLPVEESRRVGSGFDRVVVARVLDIRPHPDADKIRLIDVDPGDGGPLQIVCGAWNFAVGDLVPFAQPGAVLPNGMEIAVRRMRGEVSNGMLCSARELGLGDDHAGLMILPASLDPGAPVAASLGIHPDWLFDIDVLPNRPDALSVAGVARDLAAAFGVGFSLPEPQVATAGTPAGELASVAIAAPDLCGRFVARVLSGVQLGPSPVWMQHRLLCAGMRPINVVVDVSNYVMLELGQPSHMFDLATLAGGALEVRWAVEGEQVRTLDGADRVLTTADGVIADGGGVAVAIAGVMGGESTEISESTTDVLLELAWWDPMSIARTSKRLGLTSEASKRYERGVSAELPAFAALRIAALLADTAAATLHPGVIDVAGHAPAASVVPVRTARINALLGTTLSTAEMAALLEPIGFECRGVDEAAMTVVVPPFRPDTTTETDIAEEVARHYGYSRITKTLPRIAGTGGLTRAQRERRELRRQLVGSGLTEVMPMPFLAPGDLERTGLDPHGVTLANPLAAEESVLRTSLLPGLLRTLAFNNSHRLVGGRIFELGRVFGPPAEGVAPPVPTESEVVAVALGGAEAPAAVDMLNSIVDLLALGRVTLDAAELPGLHPSRGATVVVDGTAIGRVGEVDPDVLVAWSVDEPRVAYLELNLTVLDQLPHGSRRYRAVSHLPVSDVDLAFVVAESVPAAAVAATLEAGSPLVETVTLFDVYTGDQVPSGFRSLAYTVRLRPTEHTLTAELVNETIDTLAAAVAGAHEGQLRR